MKYIFTFFLLGLLLISTSLVAQNKSAKVYVASVSGSGSLPPQQLKRRNDEIKFQATTKVSKNLPDLLNTLTFDGIGEAERTTLIQNSFLPSQNQVFYGDDVVVEDDIDPTHTSSENAVDVGVEKYLRDMDLFYVKSDTITIAFSQIITSEVQEGKDYPYIKVFFTQSFRGKHSQIKTAYRPVQRVAELRAELVDGKWRTFITRLAFLRPGEALTQLSKPVISKEFSPKRPIDGSEKLFRRAENATDSVTAKWDQNWLNISRSSLDQLPTGFYQRNKTGNKGQGTISITLTKDDQQLTFQRIDGSTIFFKQIIVIDTKGQEELKRKYRTRGWLQIATGIVALGASYAGYTSLHSNYDAYTARLASLNSEYAIWQTLSQQPGGNPGTPMAFTAYASPGIYAVYGGWCYREWPTNQWTETVVKSRKNKDTIS